MWVVSFLLAGFSCTLLNKAAVDAGYDLPMTLTLVGQVGGLLCSLPTVFSATTPTLCDTSIMVLSGVLNAVSLFLGNYALMTVSLSETQMLKNLLPSLVLFLTVCCRIRRVQCSEVLLIFFVSVLTVCAQSRRSRFLLEGTVACVVSNLVEAARVVLVEVVVQYNDKLVVTCVSTASATFSMLFYVLLSEGDAFHSYYTGKFFKNWFLFLGIFASASAICLTSPFVVEAYSSVGLKMVASLRSACVVAFAVFFVGEEVDPVALAEYAFASALVLLLLCRSRRPETEDKEDDFIP